MINSPPISNWFENPSYYEDVIRYAKGDILVLLTDGVTECKNERGEMFTNFLTFDDVKKFRELKTARPLAAIFKGAPLYNGGNSPR